MNPIEEQRQLIDILYRLIHDSLNGDFDTASCLFEYFVSMDDESTSISTRLSYVKDGETKHARLSYPDDAVLYDVIPQLHAKMKAHTGGNWRAFTLRINEDGSVKVNFEYPEK
ncbi:hypothetical protein J2X72_003049 [Phyllobacterium sp. 1468]|uniref:hypothetical protein n=1 Tax=Phyllobacterium sp. 1468 TaxID=2817759 RepID=UPI002860A8A3|nr:hypothetical protein [Phyllobacterium sp. 1468]MDR6634239.1 hypothetical protein [Phyllobacterium sp. 1468]